MNQNKVYKIYIPKEALRSGKRVLYLMEFIQEKNYYYVGITGTSNNSGISSPLKRLCKHLFPVGKTYSSVKSNNLNLENTDTDVRFRFIIFNENEDIEKAEKWLIWKLASDNRKLLNKGKINIEREPDIAVNIKAKALSLLCQVQ